MRGRRLPPAGTVIYLAMAVTVTAGLGLALTGAWRDGITVTGAALVTAGAFRAVVPERMAGLLRVRRRTSDTAVLVGLGVALVVLVLMIPLDV
ncbi:MAG: DUF3017 domain-containing protein [Actinomycetota bacterium]|nr:DUF3017 domain-containing protein [Actinomycetota bacterium]